MTPLSPQASLSLGISQGAGFVAQEHLVPTSPHPVPALTLSSGGGEWSSAVSWRERAESSGQAHCTPRPLCASKLSS